jgi:hypothetical protein
MKLVSAIVLMLLGITNGIKLKDRMRAGD